MRDLYKTMFAMMVLVWVMFMGAIIILSVTAKILKAINML